MPRPKSVTLLAVLVSSVAAINLLGVISSVRRYTILSHLPLSLPAGALAASAAVWAVAFGLLAVGLWRLKQWARRGTLVAIPVYLAQIWVERLVFGQSDFLRVTIPFYAVLHVLTLALVWGILLRRPVRRAFSG
jgi:uncharacterized membrane protein (DUF2068 family)